MTCNYYESTNFENLLSNTNSTYSYCSNCNSGFDLAYKNMAIDAVLKQLLNVLTTSNEGYLKIAVKIENDFILPIINNVTIISVDFNNFVIALIIFIVVIYKLILCDSYHC